MGPFGKIALALGVVLTLLTIYDRVRPSDQLVTAKCATSRQPAMSPQRSELEAIARKAIALIPSTPDDTTRMTPKTSLDWELGVVGSRRFDLLHCDVLNEGANPVTNVALVMQHEPALVVVDDKTVAASSTLSLGEVHAGQRVAVDAWFSFGAPYLPDDLSLSVAGGSGRLLMPTAVYGPMAEFARAADSGLWGVLLLPFLLAVALARYSKFALFRPAAPAQVSGDESRGPGDS